MRNPAFLAFAFSVVFAPTMPQTALAQSPRDTAGAATIAEGWWRALTLGDTTYLSRHTSSRLTLTLSNGQQFDRSAMLREAGTHGPKSSTFVRPATEVAVIPTTGSVVVTSRMEEGSQGGSNYYRYLTVLQQEGSAWRVFAAHSTREVKLTARASVQAVGPFTDYIGDYRGPRGGTVRVVVQDSVLALISPDSTRARLEPIGVSMFELPTLYDGIAVVRFVFTRDSAGRVSGLNRLIYGSVVPWTRMP